MITDITTLFPDLAERRIARAAALEPLAYWRGRIANNRFVEEKTLPGIFDLVETILLTSNELEVAGPHYSYHERDALWFIVPGQLENPSIPSGTRIRVYADKPRLCLVWGGRELTFDDLTGAYHFIQQCRQDEEVELPGTADALFSALKSPEAPPEVPA